MKGEEAEPDSDVEFIYEACPSTANLRGRRASLVVSDGEEDLVRTAARPFKRLRKLVEEK